jgi:hypothetical protein
MFRPQIDSKKIPVKKLRQAKRWSKLLAAMGVLLIISSCSLVKIESEQQPLSVNDLNTRLLIQAFAEEALLRTEIAADSIMEEAEGRNEIQKNALQWKIQTATALSKVSFQTLPRVALVDTWSYMEEMRNLFIPSAADTIFGPWGPVAMAAVEENARRVEGIAATVLNKKEFPQYKEFVERYAREHPLGLENEFRHTPIRESYLSFKELPDSTAVKTVGTLSEVVADATNRFDFGTDVAGKKLAWQTNYFLKDQGLDSVPLEVRLASVEYELERLADVASNSPEILSEAIENFRNSVYPIFTELNAGIERTMIGLSRERAALDLIIMRERVALDTLILRERLALGQEAREIANIGIKNAFAEVHRMWKSALFYFILALIIVLVVPFYLGYVTGKKAEKSRKK